MKKETIDKKLKQLEEMVFNQDEAIRQTQNELRGLVERNLAGTVLEVGTKSILFTRRGKKYLLRLEQS